MSGKIRLNGSTSGFSEITAPAEAGDQIFVVPSLGGELIVSGNNQSLNLGSITASGTVSFGGGAVNTDSSGRLLVGTSSARTNFFNGAGPAQTQLEGTNYQNAAASIVCNSTDATPVSYTHLTLPTKRIV